VPAGDFAELVRDPKGKAEEAAKVQPMRRAARAR